MYCDTFSIFFIDCLVWVVYKYCMYGFSNKKKMEEKKFWFCFNFNQWKEMLSFVTICEIMVCWKHSGGWQGRNLPAKHVARMSVCVCVLVSSSLCVCNVQLSNNRLISHRVLQSHESEGLDYVSLMLNLFVKFKELESVARLWAPLSGSQVRARILCVGKCYQINQSLV